MNPKSTLTETYNFMSNLPPRILTQVTKFASGHPSGYTFTGYVAWTFDGVNESSQKVWGITRADAIANLATFLKK